MYVAVRVCCFTVLSIELSKALTVTVNLYQQPRKIWHIIAFSSLKMMVLCRNINCFLWTVTSSGIFLCSGICPQTTLQRGAFACGRQWFTSCCGHQKRMNVLRRNEGIQYFKQAESSCSERRDPILVKLVSTGFFSTWLCAGTFVFLKPFWLPSSVASSS